MRTRGRRSARVERRRQGRLSSPGVRPQQTPDRDAESLSVCGLRAEESGHAHRGRERRPVEAIRHTATDAVRGWHGAQLAWRRPRPSAARFASRPRRGGGLTGWGWRCATAMRRHPHHGSPLQEGLGLHTARPARLATAVPRAKARSEELGRTDLSDALCHQRLVIVCSCAVSTCRICAVHRRPAHGRYRIGTARSGKGADGPVNGSVATLRRQPEVLSPRRRVPSPPPSTHGHAAGSHSRGAAPGAPSPPPSVPVPVPVAGPAARRSASVGWA